MRRSALLAIFATITVAFPGGGMAADDPPDMAAMAKQLAADAPNSLSRRTLGQSQLTDYTAAQWRNVRAHYQRHELVNDQIVFCGEANVKDPNTGQMTGWLKFAYLPGDPQTLITDRPGIGIREIGPQVLRTLCETGKEKWLQGDFTAYFQKPPGPGSQNG